MIQQAGLKAEIHDIDDVERAIRGLSRADANRLRTAAVTLIRGFHIDPVPHDHEDLLAEAITRTLAGDRGWRQGIDFVQHLIHIMRSIASDWRRRFVRRTAEGAGEQREADHPWLKPGDDDRSDPFDSLVDRKRGKEAAMVAMAEVEEIKQAFSNDPEVTHLIACLELEITGQQMLEHTGMSRRQWVTATQRMRRRVRRMKGSHGP